MTSALRLATLSTAIAIACANASSLFWSGHHAGIWGPAKDTVGPAEIDPVGWTPKPTAPPGAKPFDFELRRRQQTTTTITAVATCGFPVDNKSAPAITCDEGAYCFEVAADAAAGCCTERNRRDCKIPTTCVETRREATQTDPRTLFCDDPSRPRCVTYLYDENFFENLYGVSFLACGEDAGSSTIATSPPIGWAPTSDVTTTSAQSTSSSSAHTDPPNVVTVTVTPSVGPSSSTAPSVVDTGGSGTNRVGAIVGGTVGGVAGVALIIAALFFLLRRRKKARTEPKAFEGSPPYTGANFAATNVYPGGLPEPMYNSDFYGEIPPAMTQASSTQHMTGYPPPRNYEPVVVPRDNQPPRARPTTFVPGEPKPNEDDIVSPITPGDGLNPADDPTTYTWISNPTPPPQSEYSQFSPPPPAHFQSYRPYPGT
ncbi:hypothetical protein GGS26DRAFT_115320 [Hypomontagnella submonticulosa]|nr:hypothetical protein GGS26DRAFT_115320 [Hypomontagnella submonticulosa]